MANGPNCLIDGYNLLLQFYSQRWLQGLGNLARARTELLNSLVAGLTPKQQAETIVVFDSSLWVVVDERLESFGRIKVSFAENYLNADDMIKDLLSKHPAPAKATVVSNDRDIQKFAVKRGAQVVDCLEWYAELKENHLPENIKLEDTSNPDGRRHSDVDLNEREYWMREFGYDD